MLARSLWVADLEDLVVGMQSVVDMTENPGADEQVAY